MSDFVRLSVFVAVLGAFVPTPALAEVPLLSGLTGPQGYGTQCLGPNDDGSSRRVDLSSIWPSGLQFFDRTHTSMFVNTNGNITFSEQLPNYTPDAFPISEQPMIAPFWADVDIETGVGCDGAGGGTGYAGDCHNPSSNGVWWHVDTPGRRVIVTWDRVGYYRCHTDKTMSFQLVLTAVDSGTCGGGGDFDVEFRFHECQWNTGDASGGNNGMPASEACFFGVCPFGLDVPCSGGSCSGVAAQSGFDAGNLSDFVEIAGSRTANIHNVLCTDSNVGTAGLWRFQIRSGTVICPDAGQECNTGLQGACGIGRTQCVGGGTECRQQVEPSPEHCDALDNDCDGSVDEGGDLCGEYEVCSDGVCLDTCFEGSCPEGQVCTADDRCVDEGCEDVDCADGQRCVGGICVGACDGIGCPAGQSCRAGRCVDLCADAECDDCTVCDEGLCVPRCDVVACGGGEECDDSGRCVDAGCANVDCGAGMACRDGECVDACDGAVCPRGEMCRGGQCVPEDSSGGVTTDGGTGTGGPDGSVPPTADGSVDGGAGAMDGGPESPGGGPGRAPEPQCACRVGPTQPVPPATLLFGLGLGLMLWYRRRRA